RIADHQSRVCPSVHALLDGATDILKRELGKFARRLWSESKRNDRHARAWVIGSLGACDIKHERSGRGRGDLKDRCDTKCTAANEEVSAPLFEAAGSALTPSLQSGLGGPCAIAPRLTSTPPWRPPPPRGQRGPASR